MAGQEQPMSTRISRDEPLTYLEQRELAAQLFPEIAKFILDEANCYKAVFAKIQENKPLRERFVNSKELPIQWRYYWAKNVGDVNAMIIMMPRISDNLYWEQLWLKHISPKYSEEYPSPEATNPDTTLLHSCSCPHCQKSLNLKLVLAIPE